MFGTLRRYRDAPHPLWFFAILTAFSLSVVLFGFVVLTPVHAVQPEGLSLSAQADGWPLR